MDSNKPIIFLVLIFAVVLTAYTIIKVMAPSRSSGRMSEHGSISIHEIEDKPEVKKTTSGGGSAPTVSGISHPGVSLRMASVSDLERSYESFGKDLEERQQVLSDSAKKRQEFTASMNGRAGSLFKEGLDHAGNQNYDKAIESFLAAIKEEPNNMTIRLLAFKKLAALYKEKNDDKKYYVATFKYLEVLEKVEKNPDEVEGIRGLKAEIRGKLAKYGE